MAISDQNLAKIAEKILKGSKFLQASSYKDYIAKTPQFSENQTLVFRVKVFYDKRIYRDIELTPEDTLEDVHLIIQKAFDFGYDHLYAFFLDNKRWSRHAEVGAQESSPEQGTRKAHKVNLSHLILLPKQKFLYLFDFGDEWLFEVEFRGTCSREKGIKYPRIIKIQGNPPKQYGDENEEE